MATVDNDLRSLGQNKKLYWLMGMLDIRDKEDVGNLVWSHTDGRTTHTNELTYIECRELIRFLEKTMRGCGMSRSQRIDDYGRESQVEELDRKRKGVIKAIFAWFESKGEKPTMDYVKQVACRAGGANRFNDISPTCLTRIYNEFCEKQQVMGVKNRFKNR